jgi:hypothetical protein
MFDRNHALDTLLGCQAYALSAIIPSAISKTG